jgi:hypothetical protein
LMLGEKVSDLAASGLIKDSIAIIISLVCVPGYTTIRPSLVYGVKSFTLIFLSAC